MPVFNNSPTTGRVRQSALGWVTIKQSPLICMGWRKGHDKECTVVANTGYSSVRVDGVETNHGDLFRDILFIKRF